MRKGRPSRWDERPNEIRDSLAYADRLVFGARGLTELIQPIGEHAGVIHGFRQAPDELLHLIFTQPGTDPEFGPHFLRTLLAGDGRFAYRAGDGRWIARVHEALAMPLAQASFVIVDI